MVEFKKKIANPFVKKTLQNTTVHAVHLNSDTLAIQTMFTRTEPPI